MGKPSVVSVGAFGSAGAVSRTAGAAVGAGGATGGAGCWVVPGRGNGCGVCPKDDAATTAEMATASITGRTIHAHYRSQCRPTVPPMSRWRPLPISAVQAAPAVKLFAFCELSGYRAPQMAPVHAGSYLAFE